ncbi:MAG: DNA primase [Rhabdochlamydiaceae bacterium]|nr:DNA primase [Rhabdochlamydiaceae bacterium]
MPLYTKESLDLLRQRIDLPEVVGSYLALKKAGSSYKALCPFHEEKTPSFMINRGDTHYHCFGCGAHGDAIAFLMNFQKLGFVEAIESLAERFGVVLERIQQTEETGPSKMLLRDAVELATQFYHFLLLYSEEAAPSLKYLYDRGIDQDFIQQFQVGYAPRDRKALQKLLHSRGFSDLVLQKAGLVSVSEQGPNRDFFSERITFPIRDGVGHVIGFSARKFKEETFGGKYINTSETPLFKKSQVLFGLSYSRKKIMKEKKALIVEGQIDCLRLIKEGYDWAVAGQGTAFGEGHVRELVQLGVQSVYLALDADTAGEEAAVKIGDLFQKKGIEVWVVQLPSGQDPDAILRKKGPQFFDNLLKQPLDYLSFLVQKFSKTHRVETPTGKHQLAEQLIQRIRSWDQPVLIHESLRKLAELLKLPQEVINMGPMMPTIIKREGHVTQDYVDADKILETDLLRLLFFSGEGSEALIQAAKTNLIPTQLKVPMCRRLFELVLQGSEEGHKIDLLTCAGGLEQEEEGDLVLEMMKRKINPEKAKASLQFTLKRILERNWLEERERIKLALHSGSLTEEEALELAKQFDLLKKQVPTITLDVEG